MAMLATSWDGPGCETWADHEFRQVAAMTTGRHPVLGHYQTVSLRCRRCLKQTVETRWLRLHAVRMPGKGGSE
jgi:hypothetical protein